MQWRHSSGHFTANSLFLAIFETFGPGSTGMIMSVQISTKNTTIFLKPRKKKFVPGSDIFLIIGVRKFGNRQKKRPKMCFYSIKKWKLPVISQWGHYNQKLHKDIYFLALQITYWCTLMYFCSDPLKLYPYRGFGVKSKNVKKKIHFLQNLGWFFFFFKLKLWMLFKGKLELLKHIL